MPIVRSGYRPEADKAELASFYASAGWKAARATVIARAGGICELCGKPQTPGQPFDVAHLASSTLDLLRGGENPCDPARLAAAHRRCHRNYVHED